MISKSRSNRNLATEIVTLVNNIEVRRSCGIYDRAMWVPSVHDRHNAGTILGNAKKCWLSHIEVLSGHVAPASSVCWYVRVGRAEVGGSDCDGGAAWYASCRTSTLDLKARPAWETATVKSSAQCCSVGPIPVRNDVSIAAGTTCRDQV